MPLLALHTCKHNGSYQQVADCRYITISEFFGFNILNNYAGMRQQIVSLKCFDILVPATPDLAHQPAQVTETTLTVSWTVNYNGGESITEYTVRWRLASSDSDWVSHPLTTGLLQNGGEHTLVGLQRKAQYSVEVIAINKIGPSKSGTNMYTTLCCK